MSAGPAPLPDPNAAPAASTGAPVRGLWPLFVGSFFLAEA